MKYAILFQEAEADQENGDCPIGNAAYYALVEKLGRTGFAMGEDNGWSCVAVDSEDKLPELARALPGHTIRPVTPQFIRQAASLFGEFGPEPDSFEGWYDRSARR